MNVDRFVNDRVGSQLILVGLAVMAVAIAWIAIREFRRPKTGPAAADYPASSVALGRTGVALLLLAILAGTFVRFVGLDQKSLAHPEIFIPGINLPAGMSDPPPRHEFIETLSWHFHYEPHPVGYYLAMWAWTKQFGTSVASLRTPAMLAGILSIVLIYRVGALAYSPRVGVVAAGLLALHGAHVFWSQVARMYAPGACLGLLSTWILLMMTRAPRPRVDLEAAYVLTTLAGTMTVEFFWPFLLAQILWTALNHRQTSRRLSRTATVQTLAFILAAPMLTHAAMLGRDEATPPPTLTFLRDYFSFGFLFQHGAFPTYFFNYPAPVALGVLAVSLALIAAGLRAGPREPRDHEGHPLGIWSLSLCAIGASLIMLGLAGLSYVRREELAELSVLPPLALLIPLACGAAGFVQARTAPAIARWVGQARLPLVPLLAFVPALVVFAVSYKLTLTAPRAFLIFVPYVLLVVAAGAVALSRNRGVAAAMVVSLTALFATSTALLRKTPVSPRDYQGLAREIQARMQSTDLIFTPRSHWAYTPMYYYLDQHRLVARRYDAAVRRAPNARVWVLSFRREPPTDDMAKALTGYRLAEAVHTLEADAVLYVPTR